MVMRGTTNCAILRVIAELNGVFILTIVVFISISMFVHPKRHCVMPLQLIKPLGQRS